MPFQDEEAYIGACLDSFLSQKSEKFDSEIICVDDRSADEGAQIVSRYKNAHNRVKLLSNQGAGILDALNTGCQAAKGEFISRMDADDQMPANKLERLYDLLENGLDLSTGKVEYFATDKPLGDGYVKYAAWLNSLVDNDSHFDQIYRECPIASPNWLIKRETLDSIGGFGSRYPEDYDLMFRARAAGLKIGASSEVTHLWRDHESRASRNDPNYLDNSFLELKCDHFLEQDYDFSRQLVLIGAGRRGKHIASRLGQVIDHWVTNNSNKQGHDIQGIKLGSYANQAFSGEFQFISSLSSPADRDEFEARISSFELKEGQDYFHFC